MKVFTILAVIGAVVCMVSCEDESSLYKNSALYNVEMASRGDDDGAEISDICSEGDLAECARDFFAHSASCNVVQNPSNEPLHKDTHFAYVPKINATFVLTRAKFSNLDGNIETFYINKKSGNVVMSVNFKGIKLNVPETKFFINRRGQEPKLVTESVVGTYPVILTAVIPANEELTAAQLKKYSVSAYLPESIVDFSIGPKVTKSEDPVVAGMVKELLANIPTVLQELFLTGAPDFFLMYLQQQICDFGISLENAYNL